MMRQHNGEAGVETLELLAEIIALTVAGAVFDATTGHPHAEGPNLPFIRCRFQTKSWLIALVNAHPIARFNAFAVMR
jgi:hypothetical protein